MHHDGVHVPPFYVQVDDPSGTFARRARLGLTVETLSPGEELPAAPRSG